MPDESAQSAHGFRLPLPHVTIDIDPSAWVAPTAVVIGNVKIGAHSGVWFGSVLRGDADAIRIGARSNLQDGTIVHVDPGMGVEIGDDVTVGHRCIIHGCTLMSGAFVGMGAIVMNGAVVEAGGVVAAGALVAEGKRIRKGELWAGVPARHLRDVGADEAAAFASAANTYVERARRYACLRLP